MGLMVSNLHKDQTRCSTADGTPIKILGFIPVKIAARDSEGTKHEANECLYFAGKICSTLIPLRSLKNLGCIPGQ